MVQNRIFLRRFSQVHEALPIMNFWCKKFLILVSTSASFEHEQHERAQQNRNNCDNNLQRQNHVGRSAKFLVVLVQQ